VIPSTALFHTIARHLSNYTPMLHNVTIERNTKLKLWPDVFELILRKTVSTCQSHCEEIDPSRENGSTFPLKMADRREREG